MQESILGAEYALMIKLVDGTSSAHSFNPYAYFCHSWSYFDIQNLQLVILYLLAFVYISNMQVNFTQETEHNNHFYKKSES